MDVRLFEELITKNIVRKGTEMLVEHDFLGLRVRSKLKVEGANTNRVWGFALVNLKKKPMHVSVSVTDILEIESMDPKRLALAYEIDLSKPPRKIDPITGQPVRRGRKSFAYKKMLEEQTTKGEEQ